ncbi:MAG: BamA/TamA family outer membrane protein [Candidatus Cloacimonetes bacterium]|jgi:outer membrane protein assembly factor BamA|nr:BamA/TamA family outer membrane protein [Candidatus Cloacimonadota bacterium]
MRCPVPRVVALLAILAAAVAAPPASAQVVDDSARIAGVELSGVTAFDEGLLRASIVTSESRCAASALAPLCWLGFGREEQYVDPRVIDADALRLQIFYYERGYREAVVTADTTRKGDGLVVHFRIDEGRPVRVDTVTFSGLDDPPADLVSDLPLRPGMPLDLVAAEATRDTLTMRLRDRGYAAADVLTSYFIPRDAPDHASVEFELIPGDRYRFGAVRVEGNAAVDSSVVRRMLAFRTGDLYSRRALLESQRNLFSLDVFRHAEISPAIEPFDTVADVTVRVIEGDLHRVRVGFGLSTADYLNAEARWASLNFLGRARRLELRGRVSNLLTAPLDLVPFFEEIDGVYRQVAGAVNADFRQPWFFSARNTLGAGLFAERVIVPDVFVRTGGGGYLSVSRLIGRDASLTLSYRPELTSLESEDDIIFCVNFVACDESDIDVLRNRHWLAPLSLLFVRDRTNSLLAPTRGFRLRAETELAMSFTGSEFAYSRFYGEASFYHPLTPGVILAGRLAGGTTNVIEELGAGLGLHPQKRFYSGGANTVRGVAQYRLGPRLLTVNAAQRLATRDSSGDLVWEGCSAHTINAGTCDATILAELRGEDAFEVRPTGGGSLFEANIELRFPVWGEKFRGAAFVDAGEIWTSGSDVRSMGLVITPGIGFRYFSPIGPIRVDVGYYGGGAETLDVFTTEVCLRDGCQPIEPGIDYPPQLLENSGRLVRLPAIRWNPYDSFFDRLQLHFSIGQAF